MIAIIDYGVGNIFSLESSFRYIGQEAVLTSDPAVIEKADKLILPGVGAFGDAALKLRESGMAEVVLSEVSKGKPLLGICLGMQLLFEKSYEYGEHAGLGLIPGEIVTMEGVVPCGYKVPHIGWNGLHFPKDKEKSPIFKYLEEGNFVYFVHTYYGSECEEATIATTEYGAELTAAVAKDNVYGVQFHPEKSGEIGMKILRAFCEL
ncbi:imidazole glycerol phosphate synthase subunit HisH [Anaerotruncus sp. 80]|uniref:Imidazole glycerol phosphate synthase subunit HisH n=1 Tax=Anaerotruncus colihominis TaxID=169435 RepID=A0A845QLT9_9FIRM|nr:MULTISPECIES: imidazole glycerol phosphate synthase subunit HisH [Anaerotruncus]NBH62394.1 imidazole glycerol phosphate synthase subunit HisH [Anaerotruncus colihominis]NCF03049.1 imidazole glycerol phosphate synthase subunit HisH [Anaerotruncus sp. 80]